MLHVVNVAREKAQGMRRLFSQELWSQLGATYSSQGSVHVFAF